MNQVLLVFMQSLNSSLHAQTCHPLRAFRILLSMVMFLIPGIFVHAQLDRYKILGDIETQGCTLVEDGRVKMCKFDYVYKKAVVKALVFRPNSAGRFPGLMLIPGYEGTAETYRSFGIVLAKVGFASMTVGTPGFGGTELKADFLGKNTINAYKSGLEKFRQESFVDRKELGILGYSRGAIAASLMIERIKGIKAAVLGGGIYDLKKAYDGSTLDGIKGNIKTEMGSSNQAFKERSSILHVKKITSAVLVIHGEKDLNAPPDQAYLFSEQLKKLNKDVELKMLPDQDHSIRAPVFFQFIVEFFSRKLKKTK
ncbi:MAG: alpha/beta hydrolase family protein [Pyrinomonadaceae bacterium]